MRHNTHKGGNTMVDAEWLLKSHRELLSVEKALQRRIKQLQMAVGYHCPGNEHLLLVASA